MILYLFLAVLIPLTLISWLANIVFYKSHADSEIWAPLSPLRCILALVVPLWMAKSSLKKKRLNNSGALAAFVVGSILIISNYCFFMALLAFFLTASKATKFRNHMKRHLEEDFREGGQRNWVQVLCNGGLATEVAIIFLMEGGPGEPCIDFTNHYTKSLLCMSVLGAISCSSGDTFASEFGAVIGSGNPKLVTTFRSVPRGTNGAVSLVGLAASAVGGLIVGLAYYITLLFLLPPEILQTCPPQWPIVVVATGAGFLGSLVDSYLGALVQYSGYDTGRKRIVERPAPDVLHISGRAILDNHSVNLVSSVIMAIVTPKLAFRVWGHLM